MRMIKTIYAVVIMTGMVFSQDYDRQISDLKGIITSNSGDGPGIMSLIKINRLYYKINEMDSALTYYNSVQKDYRGKEIEAAAICVSVPILLRKPEYQAVKEKCLYVKENFRGTHWAEESLYNLGELYLNVYEDKKTADIYFKELIDNYPESGYVKQARAYLGKGLDKG